MWSIVQYKRIGRDVEREWANRRPNTNRHSDQLAARHAGIDRTSLHHGKEGQHPSSSDELLERQPLPESPHANQPPHDDTTQQNDKLIVQVTSSHDPIDPHNWPLLTRAKTTLILSLLVFTQVWAGACDSLANTKAHSQYHVSALAENLSIAMYLFGIGSGCLFVGPLSQTFGRNPIYLGFTLGYLFFVLGTALSRDYASQIVCRFFMGLASSAALGVNGASVGDLFRPVERALWFPVMAWMNVVPPVLAPIVGGWVVSRADLDWRWVAWITLIMSGFAFVVAVLFLPETYLPMLLDYKAAHLRRVSGNEHYVTEHAQAASFPQQLKGVLLTSFRISTAEPAVISLGGFLTLLYIILFTSLSGFDYIFKRRYGLSSLQEGACFASIALGATSVSLFGPVLYAWTRRHVGYDERASVPPEFRLWPAMLTAPLLPISLFWLGWTNYPSISIYSGLAACFCFGIVLNAMYISSYEYIIDSYGEKAGMALASVTMMRYLVAGGMVIAARPMYDNIGVHWTMTVLGCVAVVLVPAPYVLYRYGRTLREKSKFAIGDTAKVEG